MDGDATSVPVLSAAELPIAPSDARELGDPHALDPRFLITERIASLIVSGVLLVGALVIVGLDLLMGWWEMPWRGVVWTALVPFVGALAWLSLAWPRISQRAVSYRYGSAGIEIRRGVWWRQVITVPAPRIQHTDVTQGPLLRRYGLATLTVHTAATKTTSIVLSGLEHGQAERVRDALTHASGGGGV